VKVSAQEEYGLRCLLQLAKRQKAGNGHPLKLSEMAREEGLTVPHVAKLIRRLRKAGLVRSVLGRTGGYTLSRSADAVSVAEALHALGGLEMMRAATQALGRADKGSGRRAKPKLLAVTILTNLDQATMRQVGIASSLRTRAVKLARLAQQAGLDGVVTSAHEVAAIRRACGRGFLIVVPGVRPSTPTGTAKSSKNGDDQARVATPTEAIRAGADYIVVGRPITSAPDPRAATAAILDEIAQVERRRI